MTLQLVHQIATWASAAIAVVTAVAYFTRATPVMENFRSLGYPSYLPLLLGVWKVLGAIALVAPVSPVIREWAYAGFAFNYSGAFVSHIACRQVKMSMPSLLVLAFLVLSYVTRT